MAGLATLLLISLLPPHLPLFGGDRQRLQRRVGIEQSDGMEVIEPLGVTRRLRE